MIHRAKAPLRISFAGGGTDVPPYPQEHGGVVLSTTIDKYAYATLSPRQDMTMKVHSLDYDVVAKYNLEERLEYDGNLDIIKAALKHFNVPSGFDLFIHCDAPPGSGLGSSSALVVALIGVFASWLNLPLTQYETADLAFTIERIDLGIDGGIQDQYASAFGGFNFMEFLEDRTIVNPLRIPRAILNELNYRLLLCYTGKTRLSARIIETQRQNYTSGKKNTVEALNQLKQLTLTMKNALLQGHLDDFGDLLHDAWVNKKQMAEQITNTHIDALYEVARNAGALGGKILGAGGGGYLLLYCPFDRKHIISRELERVGGQIVPVAFEEEGLQTWSMEHSGWNSELRLATASR